MSRPTILVTNDDGIDAKGIRTLIRIMRDYGDVITIAPETSQSGQSHAITMTTPLRLNKITEEEGYSEYMVNGTPVDCVKIGGKVILSKKPDLLVSGINHGSNAAINVIYSGTMAAVIEANIDGIPAIGFSLTDYSSDADFTGSEPYIRKIVEEVLANGLPTGVCLNVNIPDVADNKIRGIKVCRQGKGYWEEFFDARIDPRKMGYYWMTGEYHSLENGDESDEWALKNDYVSVVPIQYDLTAYKAIEQISNWKLNE
ncbi:MAG: 5'/3'-nucleotidase SurE [Bacteroidales bacterium]|nr:5'/3'-nucleotidase SurE [Bacteroidales bacterium]